MNELIDALRNCATKIQNCGDGCAYKDKGSLYCQSYLQLDAADAIERLQTELTRIKGEHDDNRQD